MERVDNTESLTQVRDTYESQSPSGSSTSNNFKGTVADKLRAASEALKGKAGQNSAVSGYAGQASQWLAGAADYVRDMDTEQVKSNIQHQVRSNPGRSLLIAGAAGLLLGALFRRR